MLAETPVHPGAGTDAGFVDLPVAREAATDYPVIVGSSLKGALLDRARQGLADGEHQRIFGERDNAGSLIVSDARLLALPVRSLTGQYKWVTAPHLLERYGRDRARAGLGDEVPTVGWHELGEFGWLGDGASGASLLLEERQFERAGNLPRGLVDAIRPLVAHDDTADRLARQLVVVPDDALNWFARFGLSIQARNTLDAHSKTSQNLWYEETLPPDTIFYALLAERIEPPADEASAVDRVLSLFDDIPYVQVGGNMTVGQGFFALQHLRCQGGRV
jgi:CRISPR-associated protein Cmr4